MLKVKNTKMLKVKNAKMLKVQKFKNVKSNQISQNRTPNSRLGLLTFQYC